MKSSGNGNPRICAQNLLKCSRGEIPFERVKGLDPRIIHSPIAEAQQRIMQDADWLVSTYEPRVNVKGIAVTPNPGIESGYDVSLDLALKEE